MTPTRGFRAAYVSGAVAIMIATVSILSIISTQRQIAAEVADRGFARDMHAYATVIDVCFLLPAALLFGLASLAAFRRSRFTKVLSWVAVGWLVLPPAYVFISLAIYDLRR
jgi:hypothetical protein